jgi:hypothetical protein
MIASWKDFTYAVDQMRQLQKKGDLTHSHRLFFQLKKLETEVDAVCSRKIAEWNGAQELFDKETSHE